MGRKEKQKAKVEYEEDAENDKKASSSLAFVSSDDEEANEDLSLKIVEKALRMREAKLVPNDGVVDGDGAGDVGLDTAEVKMKRKKKKVKKVVSGDQSVMVAEEEETRETIKATETNEPTEASTIPMSDNIVLRKLLRGPRYFDPPDSSWGTCYNCGEGGHTAVNCKAVKRKKPCFVCGSLEHAARQCTKARDCFICKKGGHLAKDCPEKHTGGSRSLTVCLKCGNSGHDMFSCTNSYSLNDLKGIQCYVCKGFGHLCCVNSDDAMHWEVSCYKCGQLGHTGLACSRLRGETTGAATPNSCFKCGEEGHFARECTSSSKVLLGYYCGETTGAATPSSCFKCGEEGHFARECTRSSKVRKRNRDSSKTKTPGSYKEKDNVGHRSAPPDMGRARKKKEVLTEDIGVATPKRKHRGGWMTENPREFSSPKFKERGVATPKKSKHRSGWMTEDPGEFSFPKFKEKSKCRGGWMTEDPGEFSPQKFKNRWMSPATPSSRSGSKIYPFSGGSHTSGSRSSKMWQGHSGSSKSQGSGKAFQHRFSASRFGNPSSDRPRYDWW